MLTTGLAAETPLTSAHLGSLGVADDLGAGRVGVAVPLPETVAVHPGQHLDILTGDTTGGGRRVATAAEVLTVGEATAWVAVDRDEAAAVAGAASWGKVRVAVLPTPGASPGAVAPRPSARQ